VNVAANQADAARGHGEVLEFLKACKRPMNLFFAHFIKFGCKNETFLRAISKWNEERKTEVIRRIFSDFKTYNENYKIPFTQMHIAVVVNGLDTYFGP
jgi:hypothetical protein